MPWHESDPEARVGVDVGLLDGERRLEGSEDACGQALDLWRTEIGQHDGELVAPQSRHLVTRTDHGLEAGPDTLQQLVAGGVSEGVVDLLEPVEVDENHR